jgi:hypothetical protein
LVDEARFKLREKAKQRILNAIRLFSHSHMRAKNYLKRMIKGLDYSVKQSTFKRWFKYRQYADEK